MKRDGNPIPTTHADDQGRRVRVLRRDRRQLRGDLRGRQHRVLRSPTSPTLGHGDGTATITWDTNEAVGLACGLRHQPGLARLTVRAAPRLATSHSVQLTGLDAEHHLLLPGGSHRRRDQLHYRAHRRPQPPRSFTTPSASLTDTTVADFGAGTPDANTYVSETGNGEVILKPTVGAGVLGRTRRCRPAGGARPGRARAEGPAAAPPSPAAHCTSTAPSPAPTRPSAPGHSLDFEATFGAATFQHVAFTDNFNSAWAMFSTRGEQQPAVHEHQHGRWCHRHPARRPVIGSAHKYRIQWDAGQVQYYVDGSLVAHGHRHLRLHPDASAASDFNAGGPGLSVDWLHMSPYPSSGTFTSRVFDAGQAADWGALSWHANARRDRPGDERPHRQHPDPRRELERLHPGHFQRRRRPRQLALRAVPRRPRPGSEPDLRARGRLHRLLDRGGHDGANDRAADAGARRHRRPPRHQRRRPVQRADEPGHDRHLDRPAAQSRGRAAMCRRA